MTWLEQLKPGDPVILDNGSRNLRLAKVDRLTKLHIVVETGTKFRKDTGRRVGDSMFGYARIIEPTPERLAAVHREKLIRDITNAEACMMLVPIDALEAFAAALRLAASNA